jgi:hypothetical protein
LSRKDIAILIKEINNPKKESGTPMLDENLKPRPRSVFLKTLTEAGR